MGQTYGVKDTYEDTEKEEYEEKSIYTSADYLNELTPIESDLDSLMEFIDNSIKPRFNGSNDQDETFFNKVENIKNMLDKVHSELLSINKYYSNK